MSESFLAILPGAVIVIIAVVVFGIILVGSKKNTEIQKACETAGGVQVKQYSGYACIKAERVKP